MVLLRVIVNDFNVIGIIIFPGEAYSPLVVYPNTVLAFTAVLERIPNKEVLFYMHWVSAADLEPCPELAAVRRFSVSGSRN
jgi:hypothetical protein